MRKTIILGVLALGGATAAGQLVSCSSEPEQVGSSAERIVTAATANFDVGGATFAGTHETSVAFASGISNPFTGTVGQWVIGFNTNNVASLQAGWAYSGDGQNWTPQGIGTITDFGDPHNSPFDGAAFGGWRGDPSIAPVTDPALSQGNKRLMYTNVACTHGCTQFNDVVIALSIDGGVTWRDAAHVNGDSSHGGGNGIDNPWIATNPVSPFHTFVTWTNGTINGAWLAQVQYSNPSDGAAVTFSATNYQQAPVPSGKVALHPRISVGQYTDCSSNLHEAVFMAYATSAERCAFDGMLICLLKTGPIIAKKLTLSASHGEAHAKESIHRRADGQDRA